VEDALDLKRGETVIIHGASGGVGMLAVQFAKLRGARVFATASQQDGVSLVRRLGADEAVDGRDRDIAAAALNFAPAGADAVLAFAGGDPLERCLDALKPGGRLAYPNGVEPVPKKRSGLRFIPYDAAAGVREFKRLNLATESAKLQVRIAATLSLDDAARAHQRLAQGHLLGKIVLRNR
jgi:NADPH:quinone reductase-like Zn-dependent oxidoreductase